MDPFLRKLGIELPIIQAPMAGVSTPEMAAAVSNAGGLGSIGVGSVDAETTRQMIAAVRSRTDRPFNVNVFCNQPAVADAAREAAWLARLGPEFARYGAKPPARLTEIYQSFLTDDAKLAVLLAERPAVVSFHFGLPARDRIEALRAAGIVLLATATNLEEGKAIAAAGIDAVVAQGYEAGGHRGVFDPDAPDDRLGTMALTRLLVRKLDIPVIAAGGIMDGAGIAASLTLGAAAAQLGTAFVACPESSADAGYRAALLGPAAEHTMMTSAISGRPPAASPTALPPSVRRRTGSGPGLPDRLRRGEGAACRREGGGGVRVRGPVGRARRPARPVPAAELVARLRSEMEKALSEAIEETRTHTVNNKEK